jgi:apolipoprotein N-acyltransferase
MEKNNKLKNNLYMALPFIASALLLTLIQPPIGLSFLAWVSFVPFIITCSPDAKTKNLVFVSLSVGFLYWLGNLYWIAPITIIGWLVLCLYTALLWPVLAICLRFCRSKKVPLFIASAVLLVGVERMQGLFLGGFFWRFLAHSQYKNTTIIQIADIFGAGGVSFLIAMVNGMLAELIVNCKLKIVNCKLIAGTVFVAAAFTGCIFYGRWRIAQEADCVRPGPAAAALQSNVPQSVKRSFEASDELFNELMVQSKAALQAGAKLIVWPETMVQAYLNSDVWQYLKDANEAIIFDKALKEHSKNNAYVLVGCYGGEIEFDKSDDISFAIFNSAFLYTPEGQQSPDNYNKIHLVPFGEVLPFRKTFPALYKLLMKFTPYNFDYSLDYGSKYTVFKMSEGQDTKYKFSVMICYEDTVPVIARRFALDENGKKQLNWLVNISNDGWFVRFTDKKVIPSTELVQHAAVCVFRAVENRLAVLRSVNTGISCLIDSSGRIKNGFIQGSLPQKADARKGMTGWFIDKIPIDSRTSFFSKYGEWLDFCCQGLVLILIIALSAVKTVLFFKARRLKRALK